MPAVPHGRPPLVHDRPETAMPSYQQPHPHQRSAKAPTQTNSPPGRQSRPASTHRHGPVAVALAKPPPPTTTTTAVRTTSDSPPPARAAAVSRNGGPRTTRSVTQLALRLGYALCFKEQQQLQQRKQELDKNPQGTSSATGGGGTVVVAMEARLEQAERQLLAMTRAELEQLWDQIDDFCGGCC
jgi:uncharacterized protein HemX